LVPGQEVAPVLAREVALALGQVVVSELDPEGALALEALVLLTGRKYHTRRMLADSYQEQCPFYASNCQALFFRRSGE
jgi:hypothetical protein